MEPKEGSRKSSMVRNSKKKESVTGKRTELYNTFLRASSQSPLCFQDAVPPNLVWASAHFNLSCYEAGLRGECDGPLRHIFAFYAALFPPKRQLGIKDIAFKEISFANSTIGIGELIFFAADFKLSPQLLSRGMVTFAFFSTPGARDQLDYSKFIQVLVRIALLIEGFQFDRTNLGVELEHAEYCAKHCENGLEFDRLGMRAKLGCGFRTLRKENIGDASETCSNFCQCALDALVAHLHLDDLAYIKKYIATEVCEHCCSCCRSC
jgi:hypothetical protein